MNTDLVVAFRAAQKTREAARRRDRELRAFCSGGTMVFAGFLLAVLYALLTHQILPR
jgi:hypothetical protein